MADLIPASTSPQISGHLLHYPTIRTIHPLPDCALYSPVRPAAALYPGTVKVDPQTGTQLHKEVQESLAPPIGVGRPLFYGLPQPTLHQPLNPNHIEPQYRQVHRFQRQTHCISRHHGLPHLPSPPLLHIPCYFFQQLTSHFRCQSGRPTFHPSHTVCHPPRIEPFRPQRLI